MSSSKKSPENQRSTPSYHYHVEQPLPVGNRVEKFLTAFAAILRHSNYRFLLDLYAHASTECASCAVSCHVYQASGDLCDIPCYHTNLLLDVFRRYFTTSGWLRSKFLASAPLTEEKIDEMAELFYRCNVCQRCKLECPSGIDHGLITRLGRYILSEIGITPQGLAAPVREQLAGRTGNTLAVPWPTLLDNIESLEKELEDKKGVPVPFPVDQEEMEYIFFAPVSDYLMETATLMGNAAVLHAIGVNWTIGSGCIDGANYGLFYNDWVLEQLIKKMIAEAQRLKAKKILIGEYGHAVRAVKHFVPTFAQNESPPPVTSSLELTWQAIKKGEIELDPNAVTERVTYHDPCHVARPGWLVKQPRQILRSFVKDFVEMKPGGANNYCCGGGGGLVLLDETHDFRMQVGGKTKAEQIRATGAEIVVTSCANCKKQLWEIAGYYKLPVEIMGLHDLLLRAIKL